MRSCCIYIFLLLFFLQACKEKKTYDDEQPDLLYSPPITFLLDLNKGYTVNKITGDSIKPLVNSLGITIKTGVPYSIKAMQIDAPGVKKAVVIKTDRPEKITLETNIHPVKGKPEILSATPIELRSRTLSSLTDSIIVPGSSGILFMHQPVSVITKKITIHEPEPVRIQPMRYKDNALPDIQYLDIGQGLPFSYIYALHQDKNGYIWFGTDYGLCKYDGTYLTIYTEKNGLINNKVNSIAEDDQGRLWIGTYGGVSVFDGTFFLQFQDKDGLLTHTAGQIQKDSSGNIWVSVENLGYVGYDGKTFTFYNSKNNFQKKASLNFFVDQKGTFWFATPTGLIRNKGKQFIYFNAPSNFFGRIISATEDSKGNSWFSSDLNGFLKYNGNYFTHYTMDHGLPDNSIITLVADNADNIWIGTRYKGLTKFDGKNFTIYNKEQGLSEDKIHNILEDKQGNIWIGTLGGGINKLNDKGFLEKIPLSKLANSRVRPIIADRSDRLWFGTEAGNLFSYDGVNLLKHFDRNPNKMEGFRSAIIDKQKNLWFGQSEASEFYKYDYKSFRHYTPPNKISSNLSLFEDKDGVIWLGTSREGLAAFKGNTIGYYNELNGFPSPKVLVIRQDKKGNLWFGTEGAGLVKFDGEKFTVLSEKEGLFCKSITSIIEDEKGDLWLGTLGAGLCRFDGNRFTYYTEKQGLAFNSIWSLKEDARGQIWVGTDNGLSVLIPVMNSKDVNEKKYLIHSFGLQDGLKATDFNLNGVYIDKNNRIWWGTGKALITRDLNISFNADTLRSLSLNHIKVNDQFLDYKDISKINKSNISFSRIAPYTNYPQNLSLPYDQNHLSFYFSAIDWKTTHKIKYSYRLRGLEEKWSVPVSEPSVDYRNLSHGDYEFQVKAIGESQVWTQPLIYKFTIRPAWWQTWWFKIIIVAMTILLLIYITWLVYLYRLRKQKVLLEKQLAIQYERQRISSEMHDDIGAGLSGVRLLTEMTRNKLKDKVAADEIDKIYESVGDISAKMKEVIWSLNADNDSLSNLVYYIQKQVKTQLENYPGELMVDISETIPDLKIAGEVRRNIYLLVKEAVHNIIKHSGADKIKIALRFNGKLIITVWDNGKGFNHPQNHYTGNGMKNMRSRIQQINGQLYIKNANGLTLTFEIPIKSII